MKDAKHPKHNDLLSLLNSRKAWDYPPYATSHPNTGAYHEAATLYARANDSDPFAYARMRLHIRLGYELASDVAHDAQAALARRSHEPRAAFAVLDSVKKKVDADRAWNQHRAATWKENAA